MYAGHWNGPAKSATLGLALASAGVVCTVAAGFLGWMLVQDYHIGIRLTEVQERDELSESHRLLHHHAKAA
ncbi:hypothetical protein BG418_14345 [Streptomyces sp. CBMA152]|nr:hypothetical protein [Streptomyces sp. CBMA152]